MHNSPRTIAPPATAATSADIYAEFIVTYLTDRVVLDPSSKSGGGIRRGLVKFVVYATNAEDAIHRLRQQEPSQYPIVEVAAVEPTGRDTTMLILPIEWMAGVAGDLIVSSN